MDWLVIVAKAIDMFYRLPSRVTCLLYKKDCSVVVALM